MKPSKHIKRRILVLGSPGMGKTITLLHLAQKLILEAEASPSAPLPLVVNLSKLDIAPAASRAWAFHSARTGRSSATSGSNVGSREK